MKARFLIFLMLDLFSFFVFSAEPSSNAIWRGFRSIDINSPECNGSPLENIGPEPLRPGEFTVRPVHIKDGVLHYLNAHCDEKSSTSCLLPSVKPDNFSAAGQTYEGRTCVTYSFKGHIISSWFDNKNLSDNQLPSATPALDAWVGIWRNNGTVAKASYQDIEVSIQKNGSSLYLQILNTGLEAPLKYHPMELGYKGDRSLITIPQGSMILYRQNIASKSNPASLDIQPCSLAISLTDGHLILSSANCVGQETVYNAILAKKKKFVH